MLISTSHIENLLPGGKLEGKLNGWRDALRLLSTFENASHLLDSDPIGSYIIERRTDGTLCYTWTVRTLHAELSGSNARLDLIRDAKPTTKSAPATHTATPRSGKPAGKSSTKKSLRSET